LKKIVLAIALLIPFHAKADFWGGDLPLLMEIVTNTLNTMMELQRQSQLMNDEMAGIKDRINRIQTIASVVQPSTWDQWKDPREAVKRLHLIYHTIPKEYRSEKYYAIETELAQAMNLVARLGPETKTTFNSGKELERRGADVSPGVAQKLTASGIGTLIAIESQTLAVQSQITSLLTQMIAEGNDKETRAVATKGRSLQMMASHLNQTESRFSSLVLGKSWSR
jgi:hypothetical protein